ncbi:MAG: hypothetical protein ACLUQJ_04960, partial [Alphaproteobacteria bacterium]
RLNITAQQWLMQRPQLCPITAEDKAVLLAQLTQQQPTASLSVTTKDAVMPVIMAVKTLKIIKSSLTDGMSDK